MTQQVSNDFIHCREIHFSNDNDMQKFICSKLGEKYPCKFGEKCMTVKRHKMSKKTPDNIDDNKDDNKDNDDEDTLFPFNRCHSCDNDYNEDDMVHSQICDEIHNC